MPNLPHPRALLPGLAIAACLLCFACTSDEDRDARAAKLAERATPPPKEPKPLRTLTVEQKERDFIVKPGGKKAVKFGYSIGHEEMTLRFTVDELPDGTTLSLDEAPDEVYSVVGPLLVPGNTTLLAFTEKRAIALANTLTVTVPKHKPLAVPLDKIPVFHTLLPDLLLAITNGPVQFVDESAADSKSSLVYVPSNSRDLHMLGTPPNELQDIDWIAVKDDAQVVSEKTCSGYSGATSKLTVRFMDTRVRVYERRTGELALEARVAPPKKKQCPSLVLRANDGVTSIFMEDEQVAGWLKKKLKSLKKG